MLGPVLYGKLVDDLCIMWDNACEGRGFCRLYDNSDFRWKLLGSQSFFRSVGFIFVVIGLVVAVVCKTFEKPPEAADKEDLEMEMEISASPLQNSEKTNNNMAKNVSSGRKS
ncbi:hypothetical protein C0Q70_12199 [Pomacea canaliculata]|uniref:Uncharacterized protein n=1 Tax=Pomacea canaliculata TaxID=400727 RepID=A0A2T7P0X3_POMCA|nr:hypothetical protein C0Q70_12199 [Pomacea canaliculata]